MGFAWRMQATTVPWGMRRGGESRSWWECVGSRSRQGQCNHRDQSMKTTTKQPIAAATFPKQLAVMPECILLGGPWWSKGGRAVLVKMRRVMMILGLRHCGERERGILGDTTTLRKCRLRGRFIRFLQLSEVEWVASRKNGRCVVARRRLLLANGQIVGLERGRHRR